MSAPNKFEDNILTVSASPHIKSSESISKIMWNVNLALAPAAIFAVYWFGIPALLNMVVSIVAAVGSEYIIQKIRKVKITAFDGSAFITGLLLAMCLPPQFPLIMTAFGAVIAVAVAKHSMGGLGYNVFNPAHIGRAALMVSWPALMTKWTAITTGADVVSSATPLGILKEQGYNALITAFGSKDALYHSLLFGTRNGSIGETSTILLVLGGLYLIYKGYIKWQVPVVMIGTVGLLTWAFGGSAGLFTGDPILHMMAGGLMIGAFFMATDMVTIPITLKGQIIFAVGCGVITTLIRLMNSFPAVSSGYPEGVCYSILLMNCLTPLIDRFVKPRIYGRESKRHA